MPGTSDSRSTCFARKTIAWRYGPNDDARYDDFNAPNGALLSSWSDLLPDSGE